MPLVNLQTLTRCSLYGCMEVPQVVASSNVVDLLKAMSLTLHDWSKLKSLDYGAIRIEFVNCLPITFNGDILFEFSLIRYRLGHFRQLQGMDKKFNGHVWCKLQTGNINNSFGSGFRMTKCLGHLCFKMIIVLYFNVFSMHNKFSWNRDSS
jgi:hypothetical protein